MFPDAFMLSTRSNLLRPACPSSVLRVVGELVWFDTSRPVTKVSAAALVHTYVIPSARLTTHVPQLGEAKTGLIVSCRKRSSNMSWGEEAPAEVAAALPHYAQVVDFTSM